MQNLAMSDVVGLLANTRLGIMRILHWVDQALLIVHAGEDDLKKLYAGGIRTATDLESIYAGRLVVRKQGESKPSFKEELESYFGRKGPSPVPGVPPGMVTSLGEDEGLEERVRNIMIAICDDVNFQRLWKIRHGKFMQLETN